MTTANKLLFNEKTPLDRGISYATRTIPMSSSKWLETWEIPAQTSTPTGIQHGVNGFSHNPIDYARAVTCPTLVIHGEQDKWTPLSDIEALVDKIPAEKQLVVSSAAGHHQLIGVDRQLWDTSVGQFLQAM